MVNATEYEDTEIAGGQAIVALAEDLIASNPAAGSAALIRQIVARGPAGEAEALLGGEVRLSPAALFEAVAGRTNGVWEQIGASLEVVAFPGQRPAATLQAGDLVVRCHPGERDAGHLAVLADGVLWRHDELAEAGLRGEGRGPGLYARVIEGGPFPHRLEDGAARLVLDATGRMLANQMVIRPSSAALAELTADAATMLAPLPVAVPGVLPEAAPLFRPQDRVAAPTRIDPTHWFLTEAEIEAARGNGEVRRRLRVFTSENLVLPLVDGEEYMRALAADIAATRRGDFLHFTAWRMDLGTDLVPTATRRARSATTVESLWRAAIGRGVTTRTLLWHPPMVVLPNRRNNDATHAMLSRAGGQSVRDARFPIFGSHHQKSAALHVNGETIAYCGGIDLCADRWDTRLHDNDRRRVKDQMHGWHDVHCRIRGPAVLDVYQNFLDRWNDPSWPSWVPPVRPPPPITGPPPPAARSPGTHHVQVLRTFACQHRHYPSFAPSGEYTCHAAYRKAIGRAQRYIYIEDQYLYFDELARDLAAALDRIEKLVIVVPHHSDATPIERASQNWHRAQFLRIIRARHPAKVHVYDLTQPATGQMIYVHAKVLIIDDIYAVIGTPNFGRRSMTYDTEIAAAVVDGDIVDGVCRFARDLRRNLWGEHLGLAPTDARIADPIAAVTEWERQAATGRNRVRRHVAPMPQSEDRVRWDRGVDPDARCPQPPQTILAMR